jgi:inner membrane protein
MWKLAAVAFLCLLSAIPLAMVRGLVGERQSLRDEVIRNFESATVGPQALAGPVLVVPYRKTYTETSEERVAGQPGGLEVRRRRVEEGRLFFLPETLAIEGKAAVEPRRRGLYKTQAYSADWRLKGRFALPARFGVSGGIAEYEWGTPELGFGIGDPRGLEPGMTLKLDGKPVPLEPGTGIAGLDRGVHAEVQSVAARREAPQGLEFELEMRLAGANRMQFLPTGRTSSVVFASSWPHPSFFGPMLARHDIDESGFRARWNTSFLATNLHNEYAACFAGKGCAGFAAAAFGVSLIEPADPYLQLERALKYGLLFVGLTFVAFFLFDVLRQCPIHPVQYGLVGGSLVVFYLLLVSLSEHVAFGLSYLLAAAACVLLIGYYVSHVLGSWRRGAAIGAMIAALYAVLYVILRSEDNALLMGSLLLFSLIATIMIATRNVDWYLFGTAQGLGVRREGD